MKPAYLYPFIRRGGEYDIDSNVKKGVCVFVFMCEGNFEYFVARQGLCILSVGYFKTRFA